MMKLGLVAGLLLLVSNVAAEEVQLGPYLVSFDMGDVEYKASPIDAKEFETYEGIMATKYAHGILLEDAMIGIAIDDYPVLMYTKYKDYYKECDADNAYLRTIDGKNTTLLVDESKIYYAVYTLDGDGWVDSDGAFEGDPIKDEDAEMIGTSGVRLASSASWDITRQFLNTLHVEKIE